jgi:uncharacterized protein YjdB
MRKLYGRTAKRIVAAVMIPVLSLGLLFIPGSQAAAKASADTLPNTGQSVAKIDNYTFATKEQVEATVNPGMDPSYGDVSSINEFWGTDGLYHVVCTGKSTIYIYVLNQQMELVKTVEIPKDLPIAGNAVQDKQGNYYIVYGEYDTADMNTDSRAGMKIVMSIVQYDKDGKQLNRLTYTGYDTCPYDGIKWGTKEPFNFGNCDLMLDSAGVLVCRYGRVMYSGHQSSHALYVDTAAMTKLDYPAPYNSHSFDQKVIETSDGGYLFADRGDAYDRGFVVFKVNKYMDDIWSIPSYVPFHFRNGFIYQMTYATLAGIAECSNGYAIVGNSEKTLSYDVAENYSFNEPRNIFLQVFTKSFTSDLTNQPGAQLLKGESRIAEGTYSLENGYCQSGAADYGVLWLTDYTGTAYASDPKMVPIGNDRLLIMWEKKDYEEYAYRQYIESYYMVVSGDGTVILPQTLIQDEYMTLFGEPDYRDGCVYWTTSDGESMNFVVHRLTIGETMPAKIHVTAVKTDKDYIIARAGEKTDIKAVVLPENADNKQLKYEEYDTDLISVDSNGRITVKGRGDSGLTIYSGDNKDVSKYITVITVDSAPAKPKATQVSPDYTGCRVKLTWEKSVFADSYDIYRSVSENKGYEYIGSSYGELYYYDDTVTAGKRYYYKVKAANSWWEDELYQNPYSTPCTIYVLSTPANASIRKASSASAEITWSKVGGATGYEIYYYNTGEKKYKLLKTVNGNAVTSYKRTGLKSGQTYQYKIRAFRTISGKNYYSLFSKVLKIKM